MPAITRNKSKLATTNLKTFCGLLHTRLELANKYKKSSQYKLNSELYYDAIKTHTEIFEIIQINLYNVLVLDDGIPVKHQKLLDTIYNKFCYLRSEMQNNNSKKRKHVNIIKAYLNQMNETEKAIKHFVTKPIEQTPKICLDTNVAPIRRRSPRLNKI